MKRLWTWILGALTVFGGMFLFRKESARNEGRIEVTEDDIQNDLHQAEVANQDAAKHDAAAHEIKADADTPTEKKSTSDILAGWRK